MEILYHFRGGNLVIHVQVPSWHPQQHICHLHKSEPNNLHFIQRVHPHQTGTKVSGFRGKIVLFAHRVTSKLNCKSLPYFNIFFEIKTVLSKYQHYLLILVISC
jgi:hypothetical protein